MRLTAYIPPPDPAAFLRRMRQLASQAEVLRPDQHVVSRVVLDRFAGDPGSRRARQVQIVTRAYVEAKPTYLGAAGCGKFRNFVRYASASMEEHWANTETKLRATVDIANADDANGTDVFYRDPKHAGVIRNTIVLHFVRSIPHLILTDRSWRQRYGAHVDLWLTQHREVLEFAHLTEFGRPAADEGDLAMMAAHLIDPLSVDMDRGRYFRAALAERFDRYTAMLDGQPVELRRVRCGELLISDAPALALTTGEPGSGPLDGPGLASCDEIVLPLSPYLLAVLGAHNAYSEIGQEEVDRYNAAQVRAAAGFFYMRPDSGLESFIRSADLAHWPNRIPPHLTQGATPKHFDPAAGRRTFVRPAGIRVKR